MIRKLSKVAYGLFLIAWIALPAVSLAVNTIVTCNTKGEAIGGDDNSYCSLTTVPGAFSTDKAINPVSTIVNIYGVSIGIAAILAVAMIIWAGVEYATVESIQGHSDAKDRWQGALWGLLLLLASYLILRTINVDLVNVNLNLGNPVKCDNGVTIGVDGKPMIGGDGKIVACEGASADALSELVKTTYARSQQAVAEDNATLAEIDKAEKTLAAAMKTNDPAQIAAAQQALDQTKAKRTGTQMQVIQSNADIASAKAVQDGDYDKAVAIAQNAVNEQQKIADSTSDPVAKKTAQNLVLLNTEKSRVTIGSSDILNGLRTGQYPTYGGADKFQAARSKFLSETSKVSLSLTNTDPALGTQYRQYVVEQLQLIDAQWQKNLENCPRGSTVQGGCNQ